MRSIMHRSDAPTAAAEYAMYHAEDIMNALPTSANITLDASAGLSPNEVEGMPDTDLTSFHAFGPQCFVHLDSEHRILSEPNIPADACIYLCRAHHVGGTLPQPFFHPTHRRHGGVTAIATVAAVAAVAATVAVAPPIRLTLDFGVSISRLRGRPEGPESLSARCATVEVETIVEVLFATPTMQAVQDSWMGTGYPTRS